jgi:peptidoglycan/LPS O-acetylase OafA/YrhL
MTDRVSTRLPSLDGWRALAISIVVLGHFAYAKDFPVSPAWWDFAVQSKLGVLAFFVISGFLITHLLLREADEYGDVSLRAFYLRRSLRILPVYLLYLGVVALLVVAGLYREAASSWLGSLTMTRDVIGRGNSITVHYWSLAVEEQFYLLWPIALVSLRLWKRPVLAGVLLATPMLLCPMLRSGIVQSVWPRPLVLRALAPFSIALHADSLAVGCAAAFLYRARRAVGGRRLPASAPLLAGCAIAFVAAAAMDDGRFGGAGQALIPLVETIAAVTAMWVTIEHREGLVYALLNTRAVVWLGTLSYSVYVWQQLWLAAFAGHKLARLYLYDWHLWWIAALACACTSYYLVERPILRIRDRYQRVNSEAPTLRQSSPQLDDESLVRPRPVRA